MPFVVEIYEFSDGESVSVYEGVTLWVLHYVGEQLSAKESILFLPQIPDGTLILVINS